MAARQGAERLVDVTRAHVDGCIHASPANLAFAERMAATGVRVRVLNDGPGLSGCAVRFGSGDRCAGGGVTP